MVQIRNYAVLIIALVSFKFCDGLEQTTFSAQPDPLLRRPAYADTIQVPGIVFDTLTKYLKDASDPIASAKVLTENLGRLMASAEEIVQLGYLWGCMLDVIRRMSPHDSRQSDLLNLTLKIRECPEPSGPGLDRLRVTCVVRNGIWKDLYPFLSVKLDMTYDAPLVPRLAERSAFGETEEMDIYPGPWRSHSPMTAQEWSSLNAFYARLHVAAPDLRYMDVTGLQCMLEALERERSLTTLDNNISAAAVWIQYAGLSLKNNPGIYAQNPWDDDAKRVPWSRGELYHGPRTFCAKRWAFWRERFGMMKDLDGLREETRAAAAEAWAEMTRLDLSETTDQSYEV